MIFYIIMNRIHSRVFNKNSFSVVCRLYHEVTGDVICPSMVQGIDHIRDSRLNKVNILYLQLTNYEVLSFRNSHIQTLVFVGFSFYVRRKTSVRYSRTNATMFQDPSATNRCMLV